MKIWRLTLIQKFDCDDNIITKFKCEQCENEYEYNDNRKKFIGKESRFMFSIPSKFVIKYEYGYPYKVIVGLDKEPTEEELKVYKKTMADKLIEEIGSYKKRIDKILDNKVLNLLKEEY